MLSRETSSALLVDRETQMPKHELPTLTFTNIAYGSHEAPWDLLPLLYRGGAAANVRKVAGLIAQGALGDPILERLPLVLKIHDDLAAAISGGESQHAVKSRIAPLRAFFAWADSNDRQLTLKTATDECVVYSEFLLHRVRVVGDIGELSGYSYISRISALLTRALDLSVSPLVNTRISKRIKGKRVLGTEAEKQNLNQAFEFGHALLDVANELTIETIKGPLPVRIVLRSGHSLIVPCKLRPIEQIGSRRSEGSKILISMAQKRRAGITCGEWRIARHSLINLRIEVEMLIFISQTGINLAQASELSVEKFRYRSFQGGYKVTGIYKGRRGGDVSFEIYTEYRPHLESYLRWRAIVVAGIQDNRMFPFIAPPGKVRSPRARTVFSATIKLLAQAQIRVIRPRELRTTKANWFLRRTKDPALTAEMNQHSQETLLRVYDQPHHQIAVVEISRFHSAVDPAIAMPGPGVCINALPRPVEGLPNEAPPPDCANPAGCLFCDHQRDIDDSDHVWSLATYRHLKSLELAKYRSRPSRPNDHPAMASVDRISAKLRHIGNSRSDRERWVREAVARVDEGDYHPKWDGFLRILESQFLEPST